MEENNKKLEENKKFLDPETNFLEDQYRTQRQEYPQRRSTLQSQLQRQTASNQMQSPKKKEGWFSNVTNPFTSAMREHQSKLNTGSIAPDAKARKIVPPKKRKGKYQQ